ncbi:MAG: SMP-30/gluconolactonase/LRE family protein [Erythrobacter sp.]|nr:SMP-30/gluconolactonase/LRE family protein [Erythrobacter sp.]
MTLRTTILALALASALATPAMARDLLAGEVDTEIPAIPGVVGEDADWDIAWMGPMAADGMATAPDGRLLFAQEQSNAIWALWPDGQSFVEVPYVLGAGAVSVDGQGRMIAVERACSDPGLSAMTCNKVSAVVLLSPARTVIADHQADGSPLGRLNDVQADGHGGAWFTEGALWHTDAAGNVSRVAEAENFTNGLVLSPDGRTLYVTDRMAILAFDVGADASLSNRRTFATLGDTQGFGGDGMTVDADGRLYVTGDAGVYVYAPDGAQLGVIPVPRRSITLAFAGPDRRTLLVGALGAVTPAGEAWVPAEGVRNIAMTIYAIPTLAAGVR